MVKSHQRTISSYIPDEIVLDIFNPITVIVFHGDHIATSQHNCRSRHAMENQKLKLQKTKRSWAKPWPSHGHYFEFEFAWGRTVSVTWCDFFQHSASRKPTWKPTEKAEDDLHEMANSWIQQDSTYGEWINPNSFEHVDPCPQILDDHGSTWFSKHRRCCSVTVVTKEMLERRKTTMRALLHRQDGTHGPLKRNWNRRPKLPATAHWSVYNHESWGKRKYKSSPRFLRKPIWDDLNAAQMVNWWDGILLGLPNYYVLQF